MKKKKYHNVERLPKSNGNIIEREAKISAINTNIHDMTFMAWYRPFNKKWRFMVINATSNNISVISLRLVLLVEETGIPGENHRPVASH